MRCGWSRENIQSDLVIKRATNTYPRYRYFSTRETVFAGTLFAIFVRYSAANICTNIYTIAQRFPGFAEYTFETRQEEKEKKSPRSLDGSTKRKEAKRLQMIVKRERERMRENERKERKANVYQGKERWLRSGKLVIFSIDSAKRVKLTSNSLASSCETHR